MDKLVDDFLGVFAVLCRGDRYLMVQNKRLINGKLQIVWDLPGGRVESREMLQEALRRELLEETQLVLRGGPEFVFLQEGQRVIDSVRRYTWRSFFFRVEATGDPVASNEVLDTRWMTTDEIEHECCAPYHLSFREWLSNSHRSYFVSQWLDE